MEQQLTGITPDFVGYEYTSVRVSAAHESMVVDGYRNFGWLPDGSRNGMLRFKRDRSLLNKTELTRLQRQFDSHLRELDSLEKAPGYKSSLIGWCVGLLGCVFLGGATFSYLGGFMVLMVVLAVPGFLCWLGAAPIANKIRRVVEVCNEPTIDHLYDMNYDVCRRANSLLMRGGAQMGDARASGAQPDESQSDGE